MREYVSVSANGTVAETDDEIILSFYGPRGGSRACESVSVEAARKLRDHLNQALNKFDYRKGE